MRDEDIKKERRKSQGRKGTLSNPSSVKFDSALDSPEGPSSLKSSSGDLKD